MASIIKANINGTNVATAPRDDQGGQPQQAQSLAPQADDLPF